jgi:hypothetical protein
MSVTIAHAITLAPKVAGRGAVSERHGGTPAGAFWTRLMRSFAKRSVPADHEYERLLEGSGGKFTDALEREAERRTLHRQQL